MAQDLVPLPEYSRQLPAISNVYSVHQIAEAIRRLPATQKRAALTRLSLLVVEVESAAEEYSRSGTVVLIGAAVGGSLGTGTTIALVTTATVSAVTVAPLIVGVGVLIGCCATAWGFFRKGNRHKKYAEQLKIVREAAGSKK